MRGHAEVVAAGEPPAWQAGYGVEGLKGIASLGAVEHLVRAIRGERAARMLRDQREADRRHRLVWEALGAVAAMPEDRKMVPAATGRGSGR